MRTSPPSGFSRRCTCEPLPSCSVSLRLNPVPCSIEWLFTLFAKALPVCVTAWIWCDPLLTRNLTWRPSPLKTLAAACGLRRDHIFSFGDVWIFNAALGLLKFLEPHLLLQDDMILGKLLKSIVPTRLQFEGGTYPPEAYETPALWEDYYRAAQKIHIKDKEWAKFEKKLKLASDYVEEEHEEGERDEL